MKNKNSIDVEPFLNFLRLLNEKEMVFPSEINEMSELRKLTPKL